ncbi:MAG: hypothetical protein AAGE76_07535, partial [Pseudomonadota bacterium]
TAFLALEPALGDVPPENTSLIELRSRVFDVRTNASEIRRDDHFIPLTDVKWFNNAKEYDPHLHPTVIHIESRPGGVGRYIWFPDEASDRHPHTEGIADFFFLEGYEVRWLSGGPPGVNGVILLFPKDSPEDFYVSCVYVKSEGVPKFCGMRVSYPPDPDLRIKVRIYQVTSPLNDFRTMARKVRTMVYCLDVTEAVKAGTWTQGPHIDPDGPLPDLFNCRDLQS